VQIGLHVEYW